MKICHLIDHVGLGGAQRVVTDLIEGRGSGIEHSVISLRASAVGDTEERLNSLGTQYQNLNLTKTNPLGLLQLRRELEQTRADLLHAHLDYSNTFGIAAALSLGKMRPVLLSHLHDAPLDRPANWYRLALGALAPRVEAHIAPTTGVADASMRGLWLRPQRMEVIAPSVDLAVFSGEAGAEVAVGKIRRNAKRVIGVVARLSPQKSIHSLIETMPQLLAEEPSTRLLVVGQGPLRAALEGECARHGVIAAVTFLGFQSDMAKVYAALDVLVLPSRYEGFGIVLIEAMAMGVPVVATKVRGIEDVVEDEKTGLMAPYNNPKMLASKILRLFDDRALRDRLRATARQHVEKNYSRGRMVSAFEKLYVDLIARRGA